MRAGATLASRGGNLGTWVGKISSNYKIDPEALREMSEAERSAAMRNAKNSAFRNITTALAQNISVGQISQANIRTLINRTINSTARRGR
jgi:hypothetical protein